MLGMKGSVYIIPDENKILEDEFYQEVKKDHIEAFIAFSDKYKLDYNFTSEDSTTAPYVVAKDGHLVVKIEEDSGLVVCYIPKVVTDRQANWIHANSEKITKYTLVGGFGLKEAANGNDAVRIKGLDNIIRACDIRNMYYEKKEVDKYVR
ncbi:MAG TPA: hypothetical protein DCY94_03275 [Firmicutes bacterium]|nr:hypothetical protein [Bacillota bacterium]